MALLNKFLFCFSIRLGAIIIGIWTLVQATICLMISIISLKNLNDARDFLLDLIKTLRIGNTHLNHIANEPRILIIVLNSYFCVLILSCVMLIIGAIQCNRRLLYSYAIYNLLYIFLTLIIHMVLMLYLKHKEFSLGNLILFSNIGAIIILILIYFWVCVVSFINILLELEKEIENHQALLDNRRKHMKRLLDLRYHSNYNAREGEMENESGF